MPTEKGISFTWPSTCPKLIFGHNSNQNSKPDTLEMNLKPLSPTKSRIITRIEVNID